MRLDNLSNDQLFQMITGLEQDLTDFKTSAAQFIGGGSIRNFVSQSASAFDFAGILTQDPLNPTNTNMGRSNWTITATADHAKTIYARLIILMYVNSTSTPYTPVDYFSDFVGGIGFQTFVLNISASPANATNQARNSLQITGDRTRTLRWKAYIHALDTVSIGVTQTL